MVAKMPTPISPAHKLHRVLDYLQAHGAGSKKSIREATHYDNISDGIKRLRDRGHNIQTTWEKSSTGARYAVYVYLGIDKEGSKK